jgi:RHS repeat-associated protein
VQVLDTSNGSVVSSFTYDEFGRITSSSNPTFQPFGFAGGIRDLTTGLVRFGVRDYDPDLGRWTSKDPILFGGGDSNLYGYVMAYPVNYTDPSGLNGQGVDTSGAEPNQCGPEPKCAQLRRHLWSHQ